MQQTVRDWLSPLTDLLREFAWSMPLGQGVHLLGISIVVGSALLFTVPLVRNAVNDPPAHVARLAPWFWSAFALVVLTGGLLFAAEPTRMMRSSVFRTKVALIAIAALLTLWLHRRLRGSPPGSAPAPHLAWLAGTTLTLWLAVAVSGRLIGYGRRLMTYFFG